MKKIDWLYNNADGNIRPYYDLTDASKSSVSWLYRSLEKYVNECWVVLISYDYDIRKALWEVRP